MKTQVEYSTGVLVDEEGGEEKLRIQISRHEDIFTIFIGEKQIAYGDWNDNLLTMFRDIIHIEDSIAKG